MADDLKQPVQEVKLLLGEILIQRGLISQKQLQEALEEQKKTKELTGEILVRKGYVLRLFFYQALAEQLMSTLLPVCSLIFSILPAGIIASIGM